MRQIIVFWLTLGMTDALEVKTSSGTFKESSQAFWSFDTQQRVHGFLGIRYGQAERFSKPNPAQPDFVNGVFEAESFVECLQPDVFSLWGGWTGQEDCLHLNVYTKDVVTSKAVLVWIHGGGFVSGSGSANIYGPDYFMERDIVLVTLNYRLGALGFLGMGDDVLPGNLGLWDVKLALEWVQDNIEAFGGDSKQVTIMGQSAGGILAFFQIVSPQANGLFQKAIIQSGIATVPYPKSDKHPSYYTRTLAQALDCDPKASSSEILKCLRNVDPIQTSRTALDLFKHYIVLPNPFKPHLDNTTSDPFFPRDPLEMIEDGEFQKVPTIYGYNEFDNLLFSAQYRTNNHLFQDTKNRWHEIASVFMFQREPDEMNDHDRKVADHYFKNSLMERFPDNFGEIDDLTSYFTLMYGLPGFIGVLTMAEHNNNEPIYSYIYSHRGSFSLTDLIGLSIWEMIFKFIGQFFGYHWSNLNKGASHSDEVFLQFRGHSIPFESRLKRSDHKTSQLLINLWTNFVETGNPNIGVLPSIIEWPKFNNVSKEYVNITDGDLIVQSADAFQFEMEEWKRVTLNIPQRLHLYSSKTWSDVSLYRAEKEDLSRMTKNEDL